MSESGIDKLKAIFNARGTVPRLNRFKLDCSGINTILGNLEDPGGFANLPADMSFLAANVTLPGRQLMTVGHENFSGGGPLTDYPHGFVNDDFSCSFPMTGDFAVKKLFEEWMYYIVHGENFLVRFPDQYKVDLILHQIDTKEKEIYSVKIEDAFPKTISTIEYNQAPDAMVPILNVSFGYGAWHPVGKFS